MNYIFVVPTPSMDEASEWLETMEGNRWLGNHFVLLHPDGERMRMVSAAVAMDLQAEIYSYNELWGLNHREAVISYLLDEIWHICQEHHEGGVLVVLVEKFTLASNLTRRLLEEKLNRRAPLFVHLSPGESYCLDLRRKSLLDAI